MKEATKRVTVHANELEIHSAACAGASLTPTKGDAFDFLHLDADSEIPVGEHKFVPPQARPLCAAETLTGAAAAAIARGPQAGADFHRHPQ